MPLFGIFLRSSHETRVGPLWQLSRSSLRRFPIFVFFHLFLFPLCIRQRFRSGTVFYGFSRVIGAAVVFVFRAVSCQPSFDCWSAFDIDFFFTTKKTWKISLEWAKAFRRNVVTQRLDELKKTPASSRSFFLNRKGYFRVRQELLFGLLVCLFCHHLGKSPSTTVHTRQKWKRQTDEVMPTGIPKCGGAWTADFRPRWSRLHATKMLDWGHQIGIVHQTDKTRRQLYDNDVVLFCIFLSKGIKEKQTEPEGSALPRTTYILVDWFREISFHRKHPKLHLPRVVVVDVVSVVALYSNDLPGSPPELAGYATS